MIAANVIQLALKYWWVVAIAVLVGMLKIQTLRLNSAKGEYATLSAELVTANANFATLKGNAAACSDATSKLAVQLAERNTALGKAVQVAALRSAQVKAEEATLLKDLNPHATCQQAQSAAIEFYRAHKH